jgi:prepilin-type N-terminal cleavage/methylation domain-containing protein
MQVKVIEHNKERGFTFIEVLIVLAVLGILAAVVIPNVSSVTTSGYVGAANTEIANVKTASLGYFGASNNTWPADSDQLTVYVTGQVKATYTFDSSGHITGATQGSWPLTIHYDATSGQWQR